jgi:hypothetical protein
MSHGLETTRLPLVLMHGRRRLVLAAACAIVWAVGVARPAEAQRLVPSRTSDIGQDLAGKLGGFTIDFRAMTFRLGAGDR